MRLYHYLLFRIYSFYKDTMKEKHYLQFSVTIVSTLLVFLLFFTIYTLLTYLDILKMYSNKYLTLILASIVGISNYCFFIHSKKYLEYNFKKDKKGGMIIILFIVFMIMMFVIVANLNRAKIG